ncbi:hypothetical protein CsSME_00018530 [Camellia sinensis var. sinensis]
MTGVEDESMEESPMFEMGMKLPSQDRVPDQMMAESFEALASVDVQLGPSEGIAKGQTTSNSFATVVEVNPRSFKQAFLHFRFNENMNEKNFECGMDDRISEDEVEEMDELGVEELNSVKEFKGVPSVRLPLGLLRKVRKTMGKMPHREVTEQKYRIQIVHS